ncbi:hypothetical protein BC628DRAFT_967304 [Trametes gibbosa]|nr:hypothetical protein BC628DRAFT_967304 [Trametes gibbosa]
MWPRSDREGSQEDRSRPEPRGPPLLTSSPPAPHIHSPAIPITARSFVPGPAERRAGTSSGTHSRSYLLSCTCMKQHVEISVPASAADSVEERHSLVRLARGTESEDPNPRSDGRRRPKAAVQRGGRHLPSAPLTLLPPTPKLPKESQEAKAPATSQSKGSRRCRKRPRQPQSKEQTTDRNIPVQVAHGADTLQRSSRRHVHITDTGEKRREEKKRSDYSRGYAREDDIVG